MTAGFGKVPASLRRAAVRAHAEGRLAWRVTDQHGRPCNGGTSEPALAIGEWSPVREVAVCCVGWHVTTEPHRYVGSRVWLVEGRGEHETIGDKTVWSQIRPLAEVDPALCIDPRVFVRCAPDLAGADLLGADLASANLRGADLLGADLASANLASANLASADLASADLVGANLDGADLASADLDGAYRPSDPPAGWRVNADNRLERET
jgi:hypothetical protein